MKSLVEAAQARRAQEQREADQTKVQSIYEVTEEKKPRPAAAVPSAPLAGVIPVGEVCTTPLCGVPISSWNKTRKCRFCSRGMRLDNPTRAEFQRKGITEAQASTAGQSVTGKYKKTLRADPAFPLRRRLEKLLREVTRLEELKAEIGKIERAIAVFDES